MYTVITHALCVVYVVAFTRALPWPKTWKQHKPLSCLTCLTGWAVILFGALRLLAYGPQAVDLPHLLTVAGLALPVLAATFFWLPPEPPEP